MVSAKSVSVSPGKPAMRSAPRPSRGRAAARRSMSARYIRVLYGRRIAFSTRSLPLCNGMWKWGATTGDAVATSTSSGVKYAGSTDESLTQRRPGISASALTRAARLVRGVRSAP